MSDGNNTKCLYFPRNDELCKPSGGGGNGLMCIVTRNNDAEDESSHKSRAPTVYIVS